jgi:hypothetical protein
MTQIERIGDATLYRGDCREIVPTLGMVEGVVTDSPYDTIDDLFPGSGAVAAAWASKLAQPALALSSQQRVCP